MGYKKYEIKGRKRAMHWSWTPCLCDPSLLFLASYSASPMPTHKKTVTHETHTDMNRIRTESTIALLDKGTQAIQKCLLNGRARWSIR